MPFAPFDSLLTQPGARSREGLERLLRLVRRTLAVPEAAFALRTAEGWQFVGHAGAPVLARLCEAAGPEGLFVERIEDAAGPWGCFAAVPISPAGLEARLCGFGPSAQAFDADARACLCDLAAVAEDVFAGVALQHAEVLFDVAAEALLVFDDAGRIQRINHTAERIFGYEAAELFGLGIEVLFPEAAPPDGWLAGDPARLREGIETLARRQDGEWRLLELTISTSREANGMFLAVARKVSQSRLAQRTLWQAQQQLDAFETAPVILFAFDREGRVTVSEGRGLSGWGLAPGQQVGLYIDDLFGHQPQVRRNFERALAGEAFGFSLLGDPGGLVWETWYAPLWAPNGEIMGVCGLSTNVSELVRAERARREHEAMLRAVIENTDECIFIKMLDGRYVLTNPAHAAFHGRTQSEMLAASVPTLFGPEKLRAIAAEDRLVLDQGQNVTTELTFVREEGTFTHLVSKFPYRNAAGQTIGIVGITRDISERKRSEEQIAQRERLLVQVQQQAKLGWWEIDLCQGRAYWSDELWSIYGLKPQSFPPHPKDFWAFIHPEDRARSERIFNEAGRTLQPFEFERRIVRPDGEVRWTLSRGEYLFDDERRPIRILGTTLDVTDLRQAHAALEASDLKFRSVVESAHEAVVLADQDRRIVFANPASSAIFGHPIARPMPLADLFAPEALPLLEAHLAAGARGEATKPIEVTGQRADGQEFPLELSLSSWLTAEGRFFSALMRDITERRAVERMKDEFVATVSHELRTPLNTICGALDVLSSGLIDLQPERQARMLTIAMNNNRRLIRIINDILDMQALELGKLTLLVAPCDAAAIAQEVAETLQPLAEQDQAKLVVDAEALRVLGDPERLTQVLTNLIDNALKFSPPQGTVRIRCRRTGETGVFTVEDEGPGIPEDQREAIFERFSRGPATSPRRAGSGLGLAICRAIVENHGGRIWAENRAGGGARLAFTLPLGETP